jgi:hypothetical protein
VEHASHWRDFFRAWPSGVDRRGVIVTTFGEQIPFDSFMPSDSLLIVDRSVPDTSGARKVVLAYTGIVAVKLTDVIKNKAFLPLGFMEPPLKGPSRV